MGLRTEDAVRDGYAPSDGNAFVNGARQILGFDKVETGVRQGNRTDHHLQSTWIYRSDRQAGWMVPSGRLQ